MLPRLLPFLLLLGLIAPATAAAVPTAGPVYDLPGQPRLLHGNADGSAWVAVAGGDVDAVLVRPDGTQVRYALTGINGTEGITVGPDGDVWVTHAAGVSHFDPDVPPPAAPATTDATTLAIAGLAARGITTGPDGNLWTSNGDDVLRITPALVKTELPVAGASFRGIAAAPDALYLANFGGPLTRVTTAGVATPVPGLDDAQEVAVDAAGTLAAAQPGLNPQAVGLRTAAGVATAAAMPGTDPFGVVAAPDGAFWVARFASTGIARVAPDGTVTPLDLGAANPNPRYLTAAGGGRLWVGLEQANRVQRVDGVQAPAPPSTPGSGDPAPPVTTTGPGAGGGPAPVPITLKATAPRRIAPGRPRVSVTLAADGRATALLERRAAGRRAGGRCVRPSKARRGKRCVRWVRVARRAVDVTANAAAVLRFPRVGTGRYRVRVTAVAGSATRRTTVGFTVRRRR